MCRFKQGLQARETVLSYKSVFWLISDVHRTHTVLRLSQVCPQLAYSRPICLTSWLVILSIFCQPAAVFALLATRSISGGSVPTPQLNPPPPSDWVWTTFGHMNWDRKGDSAINDKRNSGPRSARNIKTIDSASHGVNWYLGTLAAALVYMRAGTQFRTGKSTALRETSSGKNSLQNPRRVLKGPLGHGSRAIGRILESAEGPPLFRWKRDKGRWRNAKSHTCM